MEPENRWLRFGLATNPYFPEPLSASAKGPRPISLFRGRKEATRELRETLSGEQNSLILVEAPAGVGKSTFINHVKYQLRDRYFSPPQEIGLQSGANAQTVLLQIIDSVVRHASDLEPHADWKEDYPAIHRARQLVLALETAGWNLSLGVTGPGGLGVAVGGGMVPAVAPPMMAPVLSPRFFDELCQDLLTLRDPPYEAWIVHINNLDIVMREGAQVAERLFSDLREHFQVTNTHWVFLGPPGLQADAIAQNRRVLPFVKARIELDQMPIADVYDLLQARYTNYAIRKDWILPTAKRVVDLLYQKFSGDLRGTIDALAKAHRIYRPVDVVPLSEPLALNSLQAFYKAHLESNLRDKTQEILAYLLKLGAARFTQDDAQPVEEYQGNRSTRFSEMEAVDAVRFVGTEGRKKLYTFGGAVRLAYEI